MSAYYCEVFIQSGNTSGLIDGFLNADTANITADDGTNQATVAYPQGQWTKVGLAYSSADNLMELNVDGVTSEVAYDGTLLSGELDLLRATTGASRTRNDRRYNMDYTASKSKLAELMAL